MNLFFLAMLLAAEFYLESPPMTTRSEALGVQQLAVDEGLDARVVRRYAHGAGWEYVVVVEGIEDREAAEASAKAMAAKGGRGITVYRREGVEGVRVGGAEQATPTVTEGGLDPTAPAVAAVEDPTMPAAAEVLQRAVRAVGGREGGIVRVSAAPNLRFAYERKVVHEGQELRASHVLVRSPEGVRLDVVGAENVVTSTSVVGPGGAWVEVRGMTTDREQERVLEVLEGFGPEELLAYPLEFARLVETEPAYRLLRTTGSETVAGRVCWRLEYTGPEVGGSMVLLVDAETWHVARVGFTTDAGHVSYGFVDWREVDTGLVAPFDVSLERDGVQVERLVVSELSLPSELSETLFEGHGIEAGSALDTPVGGD